MLPKIFYLYLMISVCVAEDIFEMLYKGQEASRVTACPQRRGAPACAGLVWARRWALVRASCLPPQHFGPIYIKKGLVNCSRDVTPATIETGDRASRYVIERHTHPAYPAVDLSLLRLDWPFAYPDLINNHTIGNNIINKLDDWMKYILFMESMKTDKPVSYRNHLKMYSTPMRMFVVTVVLPSASFVVFFLFVIFFTGKSKGTKIPYKTLNSDKKETTYV